MRHAGSRRHPGAGPPGVWAWGLVALAASLALACGGGGGVGSGGTGAPVADGIVTGFGSVIVDGVRYDDAQATVSIDRVGGTPAAASLQLGHHVEMSFDRGTGDGGVARSITIRPEVIGPVEAVTATGLKVLGQTVIVNASAAAGPVTQFGSPWTGLSSMVAGTSAVEVHAVLQRDVNGQTILMATRLEPASTLASLRVAGVVSGASGSSFRLGGLTVRLGSGQALPADGEYVVVFAAPASWDASSQTLAAASLQARERVQSESEDYLGGTISRLDTSARTFELQGVLVRYVQAALDTGTVLENGRYVRVRGAYNGPSVVNATRITLRSNEPEIELHGSVENWNAANLSFTLRGQRVDVQGLSVEQRACLADQRYVEVEGRGTASGVVATDLECASGSSSGSDGPSGAVLDLKGQVAQLDTAARRFQLQRVGLAAVTVTWSERTRFELKASTWANGLSVKVEGDVNGDTLSARKIEIDD